MTDIKKRKLGFNQILFFAFFTAMFLFIAGNAITKVSLLNRYPWQDLMYADFQIYNRWRWFKEIVNSQGWLATLTSDIDFRMNFGESVILSSRTSPPWFDLGALIYLFGGSIDFAMKIKFLVYAGFAYIGILKFFQFDSMGKIKIQDFSVKRVVLFVIASATLINHPILFHEVGPMVFWHLLLTPFWLHLLFGYASKKSSNSFVHPIFYILVILTIGASDLFVFSFVLSLGVFAWLISSTLDLDKVAILKFTVALEIVMLFSKLDYFLTRFDTGFVTNAGSWSVLSYISQFAIFLPLSIIIPFFTGPISLFIPTIYFLLVFILWQTGHRNRVLKYIQFNVAFVFYLILFGLILHAVASEKLPSAYRYHLSFFPFAVALALLIFLNNESKGKKIVYSFGKRKKLFAFGIVMTFLSIFLSFSSQMYNSFLFPASRFVISDSMRNYLVYDLPRCVNQASNKSTFIPTKQFIFATSEAHAGRNDTLLQLIENPAALDGRTFQQWRYSTSKSNFILNNSTGLRGFTTWAFTEKNSSSIREFAQRIGGAILISSSPLRQLQEFEIAKCISKKDFSKVSMPFSTGLEFIHKFPFLQYSSRERGNETLVDEIYIYRIIEIDESKVNISKVSSGFVEFTSKVSERHKIVLPVNFTSNLVVTISGIESKYSQEPSSNFIVVTPDSNLSNDQITINVTSHSLAAILSFVFLLINLVSSLLFTLLKAIPTLMRRRNEDICGLEKQNT